MNTDDYSALATCVDAPRRQHAAPARRDLAARLGQLSMTQPEQAIKQLSAMLEEQLGESWRRGKRLHVVPDMAPVARILEASVLAQIHNESSPLPVAKARLAGGMLVLLQRLGDAYALAAHELCSPHGKVPWLRRGHLVTALNQALRQYKEAFSLACQLGRVAPAGLWRRVHAVYGAAARWDLHQRPWRDPVEQREVCVRDRYAELLLLALSGPYAYQRREWLEVVAASAALSSLVDLHEDHQGVAAAAAGLDSGPAHAAAGNDCVHLFGWSADVGRTVAELDDALAKPTREVIEVTTPSGMHARLPRALALRLRDAWQGKVERGHPRLSGTRGPDTLPGLHVLRRALTEGQDFDAYMRRLAGTRIEGG